MLIDVDINKGRCEFGVNINRFRINLVDENFIEVWDVDNKVFAFEGSIRDAEELMRMGMIYKKKLAKEKSDV